MEPENSVFKYHNSSRSEEVQDIIEKMPTKFGSRIVVFVICIFSILVTFGWLIRYPDIVSGNLVINTPVAPVKLIANNSGQLNLNGIKSQSYVKKGTAVAVIENGVSYDSIMMIKELLLLHKPEADILNFLPPKIALGEVTGSYYVLLNALHQLYNFNSDDIYDKQLTSLKALNKEQQKEIIIGKEGLLIMNENDNLVTKAYYRDSFLFLNNVTAEAELDRSKQALLSSKVASNNAAKGYIASRKEYRQTTGRMVELSVQKQEKQRELDLTINAAYNDLIHNINAWEKKYLLKAPFDGQVQFLKFWTNDQYVQAGEAVFTIVPTAIEPYGQVILPAFGAGKVEIGQEVITKLNDYPYMEYGSVKGTVASISLTTNSEKTKDATVETYLVTIKFHNGLNTNYGRMLEFKHEATGTADIITKNRHLIERLFDNLKYSLKK